MEFVESVRRFTHNVTTHVKRLALRRESAGEVISGVAQDVRKLRHSVNSAHLDEASSKARRYVEKGRKAYNRKDYTRAEEYFRGAIKADRLYAWSYTYLGHTLYQQGRQKEAIHAWRQAVAADAGSDAAEKAAAKLRRVENRVQESVHRLEKHIQ